MTEQQEYNEPRRTMAREEIQRLFYRLGYDLTSPSDMRDLSRDLEWVRQKRSDPEWIKDLEWVREKRRDHQENSANAGKAFWMVVSAFVGAVATVLAEFFRPK